VLVTSGSFTTGPRPPYIRGCSRQGERGEAKDSRFQTPDVTFLSAGRAAWQYAVFGETDVGKRDSDKAVGVALDPTSCLHVALGLWPTGKVFRLRAATNAMSAFVALLFSSSQSRLYTSDCVIKVRTR